MQLFSVIVVTLVTALGILHHASAAASVGYEEPPKRGLRANSRSSRKAFETTQELYEAVDMFAETMFTPGKCCYNADLAVKYGWPIGSWDVSLITDFNNVFSGWRNPKLQEWNGLGDSSISQWDTSSATDMTRMLQRLPQFNGDIGSWDVSQVTSFMGIFWGDESFHGDLSKWQTGKVTDFTFMFRSATSFTSDLSKWDTKSATSMYGMFHGASKFDSDLSNWDVSKVTDFMTMFQYAVSFTSDLAAWNTESATGMSGMFLGATSFNSDISGWDIDQVNYFGGMFLDASAFQQNLCDWGPKIKKDVGSVQSMFDGTSCPATDHPDLSLDIPGPLCNYCQPGSTPVSNPARDFTINVNNLPDECPCFDKSLSGKSLSILCNKEHGQFTLTGLAGDRNYNYTYVSFDKEDQISKCSSTPFAVLMDDDAFTACDKVLGHLCNWPDWYDGEFDKPVLPPTPTSPFWTPPTPSPGVAPVQAQPPTDHLGDNCECPDDAPERSNAICYPSCPEGTWGNGPLCHYSCPPGYTDDTGLLCYKPSAGYGRGVGYPAWDQGRCEDENGTCEQYWGPLGLWYPKCADGTESFGCCWCTPSCPDGFAESGASCRKPNPIQRGVGQPLPCVKEFFDLKGECIKTAFEQTKHAFDFDTMHKNAPHVPNNGPEDALEIALEGFCPITVALPSLFMDAANACLNGAGTFYVGTTAEVSMGTKRIWSLAVATDPSGDRGCFVTECYGGGASAGISAGLVIGVVATNDICDFPGGSTGVDFDVEIGPGFGVGFQISDSLVPGFEISLGVGGELNLLSVTRCDTKISHDLQDTCKGRGTIGVVSTHHDNGRYCMDQHLGHHNVYMNNNCHGGSNQQFYFEKASKTIKNESSNEKCLDYNYSNGNVYMDPCHGGTNQQWSYDSATKRIKTLYDSSLCLDMHMENKNLYMYKCHGGHNQKFHMPDGFWE